MVVKAVDAVDEEEMQLARQRADRVVRQRYIENAAKEDAIEAAERRSREKGEVLSDLNTPLWKIWAILRPSASTLFTTEVEALGMLAITLCKIVELKLQTAVMRALDRTLSSRNLAEFRAGLIRGSLVGLGGAWLRMLYGYMQARLTWKWRKKLTVLFHEKYFSGFNFYWLGAGGGRGMDKIEDPDSRITEDLNATINGFARFFSDSMNSIVTGVLQTRELWFNFGPLFAIAPYAYLTIAFLVVEKVMPMRKSWRRMGHARGYSWGKYCYAAQRLQDQQEAIGILKGGMREGKIIDDEYVIHLRDCTNQHWAFWRFGMVNNFFMSNATEAFVSMFCIGRGVWFPKEGGNDTIDKIADTRSDVAVQLLLFNQTMTSFKTAITLLRDMQQLIGNVERITEMLETLDRVAAAKKGEKQTSTATADRIEFENVTVITPADVLLVENLSFRLENGQSLLLVGHNGSGKSSIFRCLGGLWKIPDGGTITKPPLEEVFYIPQKPYNVHGTLADQLTYPEAASATEIGNDVASLKEIFAQVDLEYLMDRPQALTQPMAWSNILSLGEKQRMQIARLIYHKPRYAILDECSSAISTDMERRLYRIVNELNITYITIAHRPTLRAYHTRVLAIGDGKHGFKLSPINTSLMASKVLAMAKASTVSDEEEASIRAHKAARDARFSELKEVKPLPNRPTLSRAWRLWVLSKPKHATIKLAGICALIALETAVEHVSYLNTGNMFACLMAAGRSNQVRRFNSLIVVSLVCAAIAGVVQESKLLIQREMGIAMGMKVERNLCKRLVRNNTFYEMTNVDRRIKDIAHRVTSDSNQFFHVIGTILINGFTPVTKVLFFTYQLWGLTGWQYPAALVAYYALSLRVVRLAMPDYTALYRKSSELDAKFLRVHHRVKTAAEQIAFFDGGSREREIVEQAHEKLMDHQWKINWMNFKLGIVQDVFQSRVPDVFQWVLRFGYSYRYGGSDAEVLADSGASLNKNQTYLMSVIPQISGNLGAAIALSDRFAQVAGQIVRVAEFQEVLDELEEQQAAASARAAATIKAPATSETANGGVYLATSEQKISFDDVTIVTPAGECIVTGLSWQASAERTMMLTGRSAAGKTSVVRAIAGIWQVVGGTITVYNTTDHPIPSLKDIFVVPQQNLMAVGTLSDQLTYPDSLDPANRTQKQEDHMLEILRTVGIDYLVTRWGERDVVDESQTRRTGRQRGSEWDGIFAAREGAVGSGWDREVRWEDVLSLGEQQRMGIARMLYHQPRFAVLDECTSAVSVDAEEELYRAAMTSGTTCITVSQRLTLPEFHQFEIKVGVNEDCGWTGSDIEAGRKNELLSGSQGEAMHATTELH